MEVASDVTSIVNGPESDGVFLNANFEHADIPRDPRQLNDVGQYNGILDDRFDGTLYSAQLRLRPKLSKDEIATLQKELDSLGDKDPQALFVEVVKLMKPKDAELANNFDHAQQELFKGRDALPSEEAKKFVNKYFGTAYLEIDLQYPAQKAPEEVGKAVQARMLKDFQALGDEAKKALEKSPTFKKEIDDLKHPHSA